MAMVWHMFTVMSQSSIRACLICCLHTFLSSQHIQRQPLHLLCCQGAAWCTKTSVGLLSIGDTISTSPTEPSYHSLRPLVSHRLRCCETASSHSAHRTKLDVALSRAAKATQMRWRWLCWERATLSESCSWPLTKLCLSCLRPSHLTSASLCWPEAVLPML